MPILVRLMRQDGIPHLHTSLWDSSLHSKPDEKPVEILPGKYDTFFTREDGWVERFIRGNSGKVTGILYTYPDGELEARRVP